MSEENKNQTTLKLAVSLKVMKERGMVGVSTVKSWGVDPRIVQFEPGFNRPINREHVESIKAALRAGHELDDIKVRVEGGAIIVVDGHHRVIAAVEWLAEDGVQEPVGGYKLGAKQFRGNDAERVIHLITSSQGLALLPLERSTQYRKLAGWGWTPQAIAEAVGRSVQNVSDALLLADANSDVHQAVRSGSIAATEAIKVVRKHGEKAGAVIGKAVGAAQAAGKTKATAKHMEPERLGWPKEDRVASIRHEITCDEFVAAIRREMATMGKERCEVACPQFADLVAYLRSSSAEIDPRQIKLISDDQPS